MDYLLRADRNLYLVGNDNGCGMVRSKKIRNF